MENKKSEEGYFIAFMFFAAMILAIVTFGIGSKIGDEQGYKRGQIDALNGKQHYEIKENPTTQIIVEKESK